MLGGCWNGMGSVRVALLLVRDFPAPPFRSRAPLPAATAELRSGLLSWRYPGPAGPVPFLSARPQEQEQPALALPLALPLSALSLVRVGLFVGSFIFSFIFFFYFPFIFFFFCLQRKANCFFLF